MRSLRLFSCALLVAAAPGLASAMPQARQAAHQRGFKLYSGRLAAGVDNGIVLSDGTNVDDNTLTFIPLAIAYRSQSSRSDVRVIYEPEFNIFTADGGLKAWNHAAAVAYSFNASRDFGLQAGGSFLRTYDRNRQSPGLTILPNGLFVEGRTYFSIGYSVNRDTRLSAGVNSSLTQTVAASTSAADSIDQLTSSLTASLSQSFGSMHQVTVGYAHLVSNLLNPEDLAQGANVAVRRGQGALKLGYALSFPSGLRLAASVGTIRSPQEVGSDQYTYSLSGRVDKSWNSVTFGGGYLRSLAGLFRLDATDPADQVRDPLLTTNVAERVDVTLTGQFGRWLRINHRIGVSRTFLPRSDDPLEAVFVAVDVRFVLDDRLVPSVTFLYWDQNDTEFSRPVSRKRIMAGLSFYWDSPPTFESVRSILPVRRVSR